MVAANDHDLAIPVPQRFKAPEAVHGSRVYHTIRVISRESLKRQYAACKVLVIVTERPGQHAVVCYIEVMRRVVRLGNLIHSHGVFRWKIVANIQVVNNNVLYNLFIYHEMDFKAFSRCDIHVRGNGICIEENVFQIGGI